MDNKGKTVIAAGTDRGQKDPELEKMDYLVEGVDRSDFVTVTLRTRRAAAIAPAADPGFLQRYGGTIEYILIPGAALVAALAVFGIFVALFGKNPLDLYFYMYQGAFGTWFSWQNTLTRAAPLILTALCTALPAQLGMVIIGGEGALLIGALAATAPRW